MIELFSHRILIIRKRGFSWRKAEWNAFGDRFRSLIRWCGQQAAPWMKRLGKCAEHAKSHRIRESIANANDPTNFPIVRRRLINLSLA